MLGPGHLLVTLADVPDPQSDEVERDPVVSAYLAFLEGDMLAHPERIAPLPEEDLARLRRLTDGVQAGDEDRIPYDITL